MEILREVQLADPLFETRLVTRDRMRPVSPDQDDSEHEPDASGAESLEGNAFGCGTSEQNPAGTAESEGITQRQEQEHSGGIRDSLAGFLSRLTSSSSNQKKMRERENKEEYLPKIKSYKFSRRNHLRTAVYAPPVTPFPNWVYEQYHPQILVERIHTVLGNFGRLFSQTEVAIPQNPEELSFWVAANLPLDDTHKQQLLKLDCTIQRLRFELSLLEKGSVLCCKNCGETLAQLSDIFSMNKEGPQGAYVNPGGYVHETLTLYKARNVLYTGAPSPEYSWFPGYAWQICTCSYCDSHLGWRFTVAMASSKKLHPKKFYGISRRSIRLELSKLGMDDLHHSDNKSGEFKPVM